MNRTESVRPEFVDFIPKTLATGVLYISRKYGTASHLCCCGCGNKVVTPLKPGGWQLTVQRGAVTLYPSIGNWSLPCQSHYFIRGNRIVWASQMSKADIEANRVSDRLAREEYFDARPARESWGRRIARWLAHLLGG